MSCTCPGERTRLESSRTPPCAKKRPSQAVQCVGQAKDKHEAPKHQKSPAYEKLVSTRKPISRPRSLPRVGEQALAREQEHEKRGEVAHHRDNCAHAGHCD